MWALLAPVVFHGPRGSDLTRSRGVPDSKPRGLEAVPAHQPRPVHWAAADQGLAIVTGESLTMIKSRVLANAHREPASFERA